MIDRLLNAFGFHIVNFLLMSSNIASADAYGVKTTQLIHFACCSSDYRDFLSAHRDLVTRLLLQGCKLNRLPDICNKSLWQTHLLI